MELPKIFSKTASQEPVLVQLLVCYLSADAVQAGLVVVDAGQIKLAEKSESLHYQGAESLVVQVDESLRQLGKESENIDEVIFGFDNSWLDDKYTLLAEKHTLLSRIKEELSLKAVASVVAGEAVLDYLSKHDSLVSKLIVEISHYMINVSLIQRGKFLGSESVGKSGDIVADVHEALARLNSVLKSDHFPPSMVLVSSVEEADDMQDFKSSLMQYEWKTVLPFLHQPTVDVLDANMVIASIGYLGAKNVAQKRHINLQSADSQPAADADNNQFGFAPAQITDQDEPAVSSTGDNFEQVDSKILENELDEDISAPDYPKTAVDDDLGDLSLPNVKTTSSDDPDDDFLKPTLKPKRTNNFIKDHLLFVVGGFALGLLVLWALSWWWLRSRVPVVFELLLDDQRITKEVVVNLDADATSVDPSSLTIPASLSEKSISGSETTQTTGVKLVGEEAKGRVEVWNKTSSPKQFDSGTVLKSGNLSFTLDESVQVASSSVSVSDGVETKSYGKSQVNVTASQIGAESNLSQDTQLVVESFATDSFEAKVVEGFSGGNSKEIRVVSETDVQNLKAELLKKLLEDANEQFSQDSGSGSYYEATGKYTIDATDFDAEVGDEVETLGLQLDLTVEGLSYSAADLNPLAIAILEKELQSGYTLLNQEPDILSSPQESDSGTVALDVQIDGIAVPNSDTEVWKSEIAGLPLEQAVSTLKSKSEVSQVSVKITPSLIAKMVKVIPKNLSLITIKIINE